MIASKTSKNLGFSLLSNLNKALENSPYKIGKLYSYFKSSAAKSPIGLGSYRLDNLSVYYVSKVQLDINTYKEEYNNNFPEGIWIYKDVVLSNPLPQPKSSWWNFWNDYVPERKEILPAAFVEYKNGICLIVSVYGSSNLQDLKNLLNVIKGDNINIILYRENEIEVTF